MRSEKKHLTPVEREWRWRERELEKEGGGGRGRHGPAYIRR